MKRALIVVAKQPLAGQVKTRLAATDGAAFATELYRCALEDTLELAASFCAQNEIPYVISYFPPEQASRQFFRRLAPQAVLLPQHGATFGDRLRNALHEASRRGAERLVMIGSDSPSLPHALLRSAFLRLDEPETDVVLGRVADGGYYLIGMREPHPVLFERITWSTASVADETRARAAEKNLRVVEIEPWYDLDTAADLRTLLEDVRRDEDDRAPRTSSFLKRENIADSAGQNRLR